MALEQMGDARQKEAVRESGAGAIRRAADKAAEWQVDVVPIPIRIEADPSSRPCAVLVTASGFVLDHDMLDRPVPEPEAVAELMLRSVRSAMGRVGTVPKALRVRRQEMAEALADRIGSLGFLGFEGAEGADDGLVEVAICCGEMSDLDDAAFALIEALSGVQVRFLVCRPETWSAWGLPEETVARIFSAAAAYYRAAPWETLANLDVLEIETSAPSGTASRIEHRTWMATIMGMGREEYGLALYSHADDFWKLVETPAWAVEESFDDLAGEVISLNFDGGHAVAPALRREIGRAGWEVAGAAAYPSVTTINTLAGGLRRGDAEALVAILDAVPRFVETHAEAIVAGRPVPPTTDAETGLTIAYTAEAAEEHSSGSGWGDPWRVEFPGSLTVLTPGFAEGPGADPAAVLEGSELRSAEQYQALLDEELEITERFAEHLRAVGGFKEATVEKHRSNAELFVHFLVDSRGVPVRAVHEYHLRLFLFDWYPRKVEASLTEARSVPVSLGRFFDYLAAEAGIFCRWAQPILSARDTFEERWESCPVGFFMDEPVIAWRIPHEDDLASRVMVPDDRLGDDAEWAGFMGPKEADLLNELHARWLLWRDEAIGSGRTHPDELHAHLAARQHAWETTPLPRLGGKSPYEVVVAEQAERSAR